jgi:hypothetical protein
MKERIANVFHWLCILLAVGWVIAIYNMLGAHVDTDAAPWWIMGIGAFVLWLIGWTINYVLTGRTTFIPG